MAHTIAAHVATKPLLASTKGPMKVRTSVVHAHIVTPTIATTRRTREVAVGSASAERQQPSPYLVGGVGRRWEALAGVGRRWEAVEGGGRWWEMVEGD